MSNPYEQYDRPSSYHLAGDEETSRLLSIEKRVKAIRKKRRGQTLVYSIIAIAASVALFFVARQFFEKEPSEHLAQRAFVPYKNYVYDQVRGEATVDISSAYQYYDQGVFDRAVLAFDKKAGSLSTIDELYYAISLQGTGEWQLSLNKLNKLSETLPREHQDALRFYTALAYLGVKNWKTAKQNLNTIAENNNSYYSKNASDILIHLSSISN